MITLSRALMGSVWNSNLPMAPGQSQQTAPATAKTMARILITIAAPQPPISGGEDQESYWAFVSFVAAKGQTFVI